VKWRTIGRMVTAEVPTNGSADISVDFEQPEIIDEPMVDDRDDPHGDVGDGVDDAIEVDESDESEVGESSVE
ncbi:MAG: hypothetical protein H0V17_07565, partial [Deltaproteobacteria bacterium]|nr:hypothetical protein [Deltaproteobacteria bacterium]